MHDSSQTHREIVAAVASLKSCLRSLILAVSSAAPRSPTSSPDSKIQGSVQRASDAVSKLQSLLSAVADQTLRLPLETSTRLADVNLPELLQQLLTACQLEAEWPTAAQAPSATSNAAHVTDIPAHVTAASGGGADGAVDPEQACSITVPAAMHPCWAPVQQLLQAVFSTLAVLASVLVRACTRSADPVMVLMQLASPAVMQAQVAYLQQLRQRSGKLLASCSDVEPDAASSMSLQAVQCVPACVASFSCIYSMLAAATDAQVGLDELRQQLISSLCSSQLLPVASELLLLMRSCMTEEQQQSPDVRADCQAAGWSLLTLSLFLSGAGIAINPAAISPAKLQPGQPVPSSLLAASIRADEQPQQQLQPLALAATFAEAAEPVNAPLQQLLAPPALAFLQERLLHCVTELRGGFSSIAVQQQAQGGGGQPAPLLLPGRCCPADQDVLHATLRVLRCWRALLMGPAAQSLPVMDGQFVTLLLALLSAALAEPTRSGSSERAALRGRVIRVVVHCLQLLCSCLDIKVLQQHLPALTAGLSGVISSAGAYWDSNKRAVKSESLPYTGQVRCVDKTTGDMMVRYTMAAQSAAELLRQLLLTCSATAGMSGPQVAGVMAAAGVLPAVEQLFRQLPVVSPAHVTATVLLVELLPLCMTLGPPAGQLPLLATLRKFIIRSVNIPEPDRQASMSAATNAAALLGALAAARARGEEFAAADEAAVAAADALIQHAAVQLLPALQAFVSGVLKAPIPAPYAAAVSTCDVAATAAALSSSGAQQASLTHLLPIMLCTYQQLSALARAAPHLQLGQVLLSSQAIPTVADILSSSYWLLPGFQAAAGTGSNSSSSGHATPSAAAGAHATLSNNSSGSASGGGGGSSGYLFTGEHAAQCAMLLLEDLVAAAAPPVKPKGLLATADAGNMSGMRPSCSADCLCALKRTEGTEACQIGNPRCGTDGWCCCSSPKACSDIAQPTATLACLAPPALGSGDTGASPAAGMPGLQQLLMVLSAVLQSRLLPELLRVGQQLPGSAGLVAFDSVVGGSKGGSPRQQGSSAGGLLDGYGRPASTSRLTVNVPPRRSSMQKEARGGSPVGYSPKGYSPLGHSAPTATALANTLRGQTSANQAFLAAYMGEPPAGAAGGSGNPSAGLQLTANSTSRFASTGSAAAGSSPRANDGAFGLLRAGSSSSSINWTAGTSLLHEAGVRVVVRDSSSLFGSSPSLASLASPQAAAGFEGSPFVVDRNSLAVTSAGQAGGSSFGAGTAPGDALCSSLLLQQLEAVLLTVARLTVQLADGGMLGADVQQQQQQQPASEGTVSMAGGAVAGGAVESGPRLSSSTGSGPLASYNMLTAGMSKPLASSSSGASAPSNSYLQSSRAPRASFSGSGPFTAVSGAEVVAGIRSCLAAAGAAATSTTGAVAAGGLRCEDRSAARVQFGGALAKQDSLIAGTGVSPPGSCVDGLLSSQPSNSDVMFSVELGLPQLAAVSTVSDAPLAQAVDMPAAPPCSPATPAVPVPTATSGAKGAAVLQACRQPSPSRALPVDLLRRLHGAVAAAAPLLARHSAALESELLCPQVVMAKLSPRPWGCWNPLCTNVTGVSEVAAPSKACAGCKVAAFCSKGCERKAWPEHTLACSRLAALAVGTDGCPGV